MNNGLNSIAGIAWNDLNSNQIFDPTEPVLFNRKIELIDSNGNVIKTTFTDYNGHYQFTDLVAGAYILHQVLSSSWTPTLPNFNNNLTLGSVLGEWGYIETNTLVGPDNWGTIAPDANGYFQSPVNLSGATFDLTNWLTIDYQPTELEKVFNNGHTIEGEYPHDHDNSIVIGGQEFKLKQFHFHMSSEHTLNNQYFPMELHLVHKNAQGGIAVLGFFLQQGAENQALKEVFEQLPSLDHSGDEVLHLENFDASALIPNNTEGFFYKGSLTTPPATQGVNWFVFNTPIQVSAEQLESYKNIAENTPDSPFYPGNRPVQPLNGRPLNEFYYPVTLGANQEIQNLNFGNQFDCLDTPVYRFYNPLSHDYLYTLDLAEKDSLLAHPEANYQLEGVAFKASSLPRDDVLPVFRFYNPSAGVHFYTINSAEKDNILAHPESHYSFEGIAFYTSGASDNFASDIFRFHNPITGAHLYTMDPTEKANILAHPESQYVLEGVGFEGS